MSSVEVQVGSEWGEMELFTGRGRHQGNREHGTLIPRVVRPSPSGSCGPGEATTTVSDLFDLEVPELPVFAGMLSPERHSLHGPGSQSEVSGSHHPAVDDTGLAELSGPAERAGVGANVVPLEDGSIGEVNSRYIDKAQSVTLSYRSTSDTDSDVELGRSETVCGEVKPLRRYHGAQRGALLDVATASGPAEEEKSQLNLGVGSEWRSTEKPERDDLVVRMLGQMMDRLSRLEANVDRLSHLEEKVESLLKSSRKVPQRVPVPQRKATNRGSTSVPGNSKEGDPRTPSPSQGEGAPRRGRAGGKERNKDGKRVVGEGERLHSTSVKNGSRKAPRPEQRVCAAPGTERPAAQAQARASQSFTRVKCVGDTFVPDERVVKALQDFPVPTARRELFKFIDAARGLREFIPDLEIRAAPLTDMLFMKNRKFSWTPEAQRAWVDTKAALAGRLELRRPQPEKVYSVETEAREKGMKCILFQIDGSGERRVISHASAKYNPVERKYPMEEKRLLALTWALRRYRDKLQGEMFTLHPETGSLEWLKEHRGDRARLTRWANLLERFRYVVARKSARDKPPVCAPRLRLQEEPRQGEDPLSVSPKKEPASLAAMYSSPPKRRGPESQRSSSTQDRERQRGDPRSGVQRTIEPRSLFDEWDDEESSPAELIQRATEADQKWNAQQYHWCLMNEEEPDQEALEAAWLKYAWPG